MWKKESKTLHRRGQEVKQHHGCSAVIVAAPLAADHDVTVDVCVPSTMQYCTQPLGETCFGVTFGKLSCHPSLYTI